MPSLKEILEIVQSGLKDFSGRIMFVKKTEPIFLCIKIVFFLLIMVWSLNSLRYTDLATYPKGKGVFFIVDATNLVFHEAGHFFFQFFGEFLAYLGGTLMQCIIPLLVIIQFIRQRDGFEGAMALWWLGENFFDISIYVYDAWARDLVLLSGLTGREDPGGHDWFYILSATNCMQYYSEIAGFINNLGKLTFITAFIWGGFILYQQFLLLRQNY